MKERATLIWLNTDELVDFPERIRRDPGEVDGLAESIRRHGLLQPLGVSRRDGRFAVIYGSRRRLAAERAGLERVPCIEVDEPDPIVCQLLENMQRSELNDIEKAEGLARLKERLARVHLDAGDNRLTDLSAAEVGLSARTVRRYLALLALPPEVQALLASGDLSVTQAQHLMSVGEYAKRIDLAEAAVERGLSASQVSRVVAVLAARPGLAVTEAVDLAERGEQVGSAVAAGKATPTQSLRLKSRPAAEESESDADLWPEDADGTEDDEEGFANGEPATRDGNRVFRVASVDSFCDEVARIARAVQDGDLGRAMSQDERGAAKLGLALRQLRFVTRGVEDLLGGPPPSRN